MFYIKLLSWYLLLFLMAVSCIVFGKDSFMVGTVLGGILMALFFQQIAFLGHDLGHSSVTSNRNIDGFLGLFFGNMMTGVSLGWWKASHNAHNVSTNSCASDPDIQHLPICAISPAFFQPIYSNYHERILYFTELAKMLVPIQAKTYYFVMFLARLNLYIQVQ
jgi:fatty acid desaturase